MIPAIPLPSIPTASSLQALSIDDLERYYQAPPAIPPTVQPSTDPAVYMNDPSYIKGLVKQFKETYAVEVPNRYTFDNYKYALQTWVNGYRTAPLPKQPEYIRLDDALFDAWWLRYCASWSAGVNPPEVDFIVPVPPRPDPVITPPAPPPTTGSPIGANNGANIFRSSEADTIIRFPDGAVYIDQTGTYVKHAYITPFGTTIFWNKVA